MSWMIDPSHSEVTFTARHMMITNVRGRFEKFSGTVQFNEADPAKSSVDVQIDVNSISTNDAKRDGHLKSPDFFDAEKYPYMTFKSKRIEVKDENHARIYGDLNIKDIAREVALDTEYIGQSKSPWGTTAAGFNAMTRVNRKDWNLNWNVALETGGVLVGEEIRINIELELVKQPETEAQTAANGD